MSTKRPNPIDVHVGGRLRFRRMMLGVSQEKLGDQLGLTFQQVQKYEKGANRIGASRLYAIARLLQAPVGFFFEGLDDAAFEERAFTACNGEHMAVERCRPVMEFLNSSEGLQLNAAFARIPHADTRKRIVELVKTLAASAEAP